MKRASFMTQHQKALWEAAERRAGKKLPRTHHNCRTIFGYYATVKTEEGKKRQVFIAGPNRPGKTKSDRHNKRSS